MLGACRRAAAAASSPRAAAVRQLCSGGGSSTARATVLRLAQQQQPGGDDFTVQRKFDLLTACEAEFGMRMPHAALNRVSTVEDAAQWWEERLAAEEARIAAEAQHYTNVSLPNLVIMGQGEKEKVRDFIERHSRRGGAAAAEPDAIAADEADGSAAPPQGDSRVPF